MKIKKNKKIDVGAMARRAARKAIGQPPNNKVVPDKHKTKLDKIRERESKEDT